jgi:hypothetical protein
MFRSIWWAGKAMEVNDVPILKFYKKKLFFFPSLLICAYKESRVIYLYFNNPLPSASHRENRRASVDKSIAILVNHYEAYIFRSALNFVSFYFLFSFRILGVAWAPYERNKIEEKNKERLLK